MRGCLPSWDGGCGAGAGEGGGQRFLGAIRELRWGWGLWPPQVGHPGDLGTMAGGVGEVRVGEMGGGIGWL